MESHLRGAQLIATHFPILGALGFQGLPIAVGYHPARFLKLVAAEY